MSEQPSRTPGDRRMDRRRSRRQPPKETPVTPVQDQEDAAQGPEADAPSEEVVSRTLFSFLEPGLNAIASVGPALAIAGIIGLIAGITLVAFVTTMRDYGIALIILGAVLVGLIALVSLSSVLAAFVSRTGRYGVNALVMLAAFTGILVVANFVAFENNSRVDTTATNQFSLANRTRQLLKDLDQPVQATAFFITDPLRATRDPRSPQSELQNQLLRRAKAEDTLREFKARSGKFSFRFVDPDVDPETARQYNLIQYETIVLENLNTGVTDGITPSVLDESYSFLEQNLVTSLLVVTGQEKKGVYFLTGHDERSINSGSGDGYSSALIGLQRDNYQVDTLQWDPVIEDVSVPEEAALLVIAGPRQELPEAHAKALDRYLSGINSDGSSREQGGRVIALADSDTPASFRDFLARWGVQVDAGYIRDLDQSVPGRPQTLRLGAYVPAIPEITSPRGSNLGITLMPGAANLRLVNDGLRQAVPLATTSPNSYLIKDVNREDPVTEGSDADPKGQLVPAAYVLSVGPVGSSPPTQQPDPNQLSSLIVFGDSDFLSNSSFDRGSGADFFLNSANYLLGDVDLVSIRPKALVFREFNLDRNEYNFVRFSSWLLLPGLMGLLATLVWWLRR